MSIIISIMKKLFIFNAVIFIFVISCFKEKTKIINIDNITIEVPENFNPGFLNSVVAFDESVSKYESYGVQTKTAIYTIVYTKYKPTYNGLISLDNIKNSVINNLRNHYAVKEYNIVSETKNKDNKENTYEVISSFYYGPNKTTHKAYLMFEDGAVLQVLSMYNANSKKDSKISDNIIKSIKIDNNTNN